MAWTSSESRKKYYYKNKDKLNNISKQFNAKLRLEKKNFIIENLGSKCSNCGSTDCLEIDHINPGLKRDRRCPYVCSWERIKSEMNNLQLLCNKCHFERSQLQKHASWFYFKNLSLEEQNDIIEIYKKEGSNLPSWSPQDKGP